MLSHTGGLELFFLFNLFVCEGPFVALSSLVIPQMCDPSTNGQGPLVVHQTLKVCPHRPASVASIHWYRSTLTCEQLCRPVTAFQRSSTSILLTLK